MVSISNSFRGMKEHGTQHEQANRPGAGRCLWKHAPPRLSARTCGIFVMSFLVMGVKGCSCVPCTINEANAMPHS